VLYCCWCGVFYCQTFHTRSFGDDDYDLSSGTVAGRRTQGDELSADVIDVDANDELQFADSPVEEEQVENIATLWMSCSPGRDTEEEEEDEDDSVPLSKVYGVSKMCHCLY